MARTTRTRTAWMAIVALLFAQLALSAFACSLPFTQAAAASVASAPPCHGKAPATDPLCTKHCQDDGQAQPQAPHVPAVMAPMLTALVQLREASVAPQPLQRNLLHAAAPPLSIRHCRLTI